MTVRLGCVTTSSSVPGPVPGVAQRDAAWWRPAGVLAVLTHGTIAGGDGSVAGNLRLRFPRARVVRVASPDYLPPTAGGGQCLIVWEQGRTDGVPGEIRQWLAAALGVTLAPDVPVRAVEARYHFARRQRLHVRYVLLPEGAGQCR